MNAGDQVRLRSGGPPMTVVKVTEDDVRCMWFESNEFLRQEVFPTFALATWEPFEVPTEGPEGKTFDVPTTVQADFSIPGEGDMGKILAHSLDTQKQLALKKLEDEKPLLRDD